MIILNKNISVINELKKSNINISFDENEKYDIRVLILNIMPQKHTAEKEFLTILGSLDKTVKVDFLKLETHIYKDPSSNHIPLAYINLEDAKQHKYDIGIITGAALDTIEYEEVDYWKELETIFDFFDTFKSSIYVCWASQAALYYFYNIQKYFYEKKISGVFPHINEKSPLLNNINDSFEFPHSRYTYNKNEDIIKNNINPVSLLQSGEISIAESNNYKRIFIQGHFEYDAERLQYEYERDLKKGINPEIPYNYFPNDNPNEVPIQKWKINRITFYKNLLDIIDI